MAPDRRRVAPAPVGVAERPPRALIRCAAELVAVSERFYASVFVAAILLVGVAALAALVLLPVRPLAPGAPVTAAAVVTGLIVALTPLAVWRARALYRTLRRRPHLQFGLVALAASLVAHPALGSELWWPSCAIVMALATVAPPRTALAYCLPVLGTSLAGHVIAGDLGETPAVAIIGLWIGYPVLVGTMVVLTDRFVAHLLRSLIQPAARRPARPPRRHVDVWTADPPGAAHTDQTPAGTAIDHGRQPDSEEPDPDALTDRLTARQTQVAALLADGLRQRDIAACLAISERQVQRHIADAVARLGLGNSYELAAIAVADGLVGDRPAA